jgi:hypothetical protein
MERTGSTIAAKVTLVAVFGVLLAMLPRMAAGGGEVAVLSWPDEEGVVGEPIRLVLSIADADSVISATIDVKYDPGKVAPKPTSLELESFGLSIDAIWGASTPADSTLRFVFATSDLAGYVGGGSWVSIEFDLLDSGESPLRFSLMELEKFPSFIQPAIGEDGSITVAPMPVLPESWGGLKHRYRQVSEGP